jgi:hypothetical protein
VYAAIQGPRGLLRVDFLRDDDMPVEIDFSTAKRGQFYRAGAQLFDSFIEAEKLKQQMKARITPAAKPRAQRNQPVIHPSNALEVQA